ncbi:MAG: hypothetical protein O2840_01490 [bacterium]|nr:hypothetical protein [bacterium]
MAKKSWQKKFNWKKIFFRTALIYTVLGYAFIIPSFLSTYHGSWTFSFSSPYLGTINALCIFIFSTTFLLLLAKSKKIHFFLVSTLLIVFLILNSLLFVHVEKHISFNACFVPGYSYPGTQPYRRCRDQFKPELHLKGLFCGGYAGEPCYTAEELDKILDSSN